MGRDAVTGLVVLATSLFLFWATLGLQRHPLVPVGPQFVYPRLVLGTTAFLALLLVVSDVICASARARVTTATAVSTTKPNYALVVIAFAIFAIYVIALPYLGFRTCDFRVPDHDAARVRAAARAHADAG